jgi:hypothetical protein
MPKPATAGAGGIWSDRADKTKLHKIQHNGEGGGGNKRASYYPRRHRTSLFSAKHIGAGAASEPLSIRLLF